MAFDTIYAEGQRRYVESLSSYARQFLGQMEKPDVDYIEGPFPRDFHRSEDYLQEPALHGWDGDGNLRLSAFALRADRHAPLPYLRPGNQAADGRSDRRPACSALEEGTKIQVLAPVVRARKGRAREGV